MLEQVKRYENEGYAIELRENCTKIIWQAKVLPEQIRLGLNEVLELMRLQKTGNLLVDVSGCQTSWVSSNDWIVGHWLPVALQMGLRKVAFLISSNVIQKVSLDNLCLKLSKRSHLYKRFLGIFSEGEEACAWLQNSYLAK
ncbi:MAG: hypothetical protein RMJ97_10220 [Raineya sp.]|nr:hypothetical protein [Raineya sp.]MDW8297241.1 hypothetical protein [Raineya sp.]